MLIIKKSILKTAILLFCLGVIQILLFTEAFGQDEFDEFDEDELFSDPQVIVKDEGLLIQTIDSLTESRSVSFSGSIYSKSTYTEKRNKYAFKTDIDKYFASPGNLFYINYEGFNPNNFFIPQLEFLINTWGDDIDTERDDTFETTMTANFLLDIRLPSGIKGFVNIDFLNYPQGTVEYKLITGDSGTLVFERETIKSEYVIKELFMDANINRRVYFRVGKQVLQWGRGFLFNPTDLINVEKKDFEDMDKNRLGVYGMKAHIPLGSAINFYSFLDVGDEIDPEFFAYAGKIEFLFKNTEIALSGWNRKKSHAIYGLDFSSRIFSVDIFGEISVSEKETIFELNPDLSFGSTIEEWIPRASFGFMKSFDFLGKDDRISVTGEFYYNDAGLSDKDTDEVFTEGKTAVFLLSNMYEPNNLSKHYATLFFAYNDFLVNSLTFSFSTLCNITDDSYILRYGLRYNPAYDFTLQFNVFSFVGDENSEYTFMGNETMYEVEVRIAF